MELKNNRYISIIKLTSSSLLIAIAVNFFIGVYQLTPGGTTGMAISLSILSGLDTAITSLMITVPLLIIGALFLGQSYGMKSLTFVLGVPFFISILPSFKVINNIFLSGIIGGIIVGIAIAIAIKNGTSTGGTDSIAIMLNKGFGKLKISSWLLLIDGIVVASSGLLTGEIYLTFYSAITLIIINITIRLFIKK